MAGYRIHAVYFSPTGTTKRLVTAIAAKISANTGGQTINDIDFTLPQAREKVLSFAQEDLAVVGVPVYAGRVPNVLLKYMNSISGNGALAVAVVAYGNRDYDDALIELRDILDANGFIVIAGGAFIGEHSFSKTLAAGRPDGKDMAAAGDFARRICAKLSGPVAGRNIEVRGNRPYRSYYVPKDEKGEPVKDFRLITPKTGEDCIDCKLCALVCPMGSIDIGDVTRLKGICIKCCACVKKCPVGAKYFDDPRFVRHKEELEDAFTRRAEPEIFV